MREALSLTALLIPAAYRWWLGRQLVRRVADPAFPELRFAQGQRFLVVLAVSVAVGLVVSSAYPVLKIVFAVLAMLVAGFPARRKIFEETWSLPSYLWHTLRFWLALVGVWLLLALAPLLIQAAGPAGLPVAVGLAMVVLLWSHFNASVLPAILGAVELERPELDAGFAEVLSRARCGSPRLLRAGHPGGHWVNAFALPSLRRPAVLFSNDLLAALDPAETAAIFGHEVAHLEYFDRRRTVKRALVVVALTAVLLTLVVAFGPDSGVFRAATWVWPLAVLLFVAGLAAGNQAREHDSDVRAVELTGQAEPLITALVKIHNLMRMPRRWHADGESRQSHPSLAKRLRAIREAAGIDESDGPPDEDLVIRDADDPSLIAVLAAERLHWLRGVEAAGSLDTTELVQTAADQRSIRYRDLTDLRLDVSRKGGPYLKIVDGRGDVMRMALSGEDVERVKGRLERLDLQVRETSPLSAKGRAQEAAGERRARLWGVAALLLGVMPFFSLPLLLAGGLLLLQPSRVALALAGGISLGSGLLALRGLPAGPLAQSTSPIFLVLLLLVGSALLYEAYARYRRGAREPEAAAKISFLAMAALVVLYALGGVGRLTAPLPMMQLHLWARSSAGLSLALLGLMAALLAGGRRTRVPALAAALLAATVIAAGTRWFRESFGGDPLGRAAQLLTSQRANLVKVRERQFRNSLVEMRLSPSGMRMAALTANFNDTGWRGADYVFQVEMPDGELRSFAETVDLAFLNDSLIAVLAEGEGDALWLRVVQLAPEEIIEYEVSLPAVVDPSLRVDPVERRWIVSGTDVEETVAVSLAGDFSSTEFSRVEAGPSDSVYSYLDEMTLNHVGRGLAVSSRYVTDGLGSLALSFSTFYGFPTATDIKTLDASGASQLLATTALEVFCADPLPGQLDILCGASDHGTTTGIWRLTEDAESLTPVATVPGYYYGGELVSRDEVLLYNYYGPALLLDLSNLRAWEIDVDPSTALVDGGYGSEGVLDSWLDFLTGDSYQIASYQTITVQNDVLAIASYADDGYSVAVYRRAR